MKAFDIVKQLQATLPIYTDLFSNTISISSLTKSGTTVTANSVAHGLSTGNYVNIQGARVPNSITSLTQSSNIATAVTNNEHDLTLGSFDTDDKYVVISGATQSEYNGTKKLLEVIDSKTFKFQISGNPASPATGSPVLEENIENLYNGWYQITKIDSDNFSYVVRKEPLANAVGTIKAHKSIRVSSSATFERAISAYTKHNTDILWAFVILGETTATKSSEIKTDGVAKFDNQTAYRQNLYQRFSIYTIEPTKISISGREARDRAEEIRVILLKCLVGVKFDSLTDSQYQYVTVFSRDNVEEYPGAYYIHNFEFENTYDLNDADIVEKPFSTAWKEIEFSQLNEFNVEVRNIKAKLQGD